MNLIFKIRWDDANLKLNGAKQLASGYGQLYNSAFHLVQ
jgi:hypothetical protein